jgi:hypothetical protein
MKYIVFITLTIIILTGCSNMEEEITWNTKNVPAKAVVEGSIISDTCYQRIRLTQSADYFLNDKTPRISDAQVTVTDGSHIYIFEESDSVPGDYYSTERFAGIPGITYNLNVNLQEPLDGTSTLSANDQMIQGFSIDSLKVYVFKNPYAAFRQEDDEDVDTTIVVFYMIGKQPKDVVNYYLVQIYRNGVPAFDNIGDMELINDEYSEDPEETELFFFYEKNVAVNDTMSIELTSVSKEFYEYVSTLKNLATPPDAMGFSGPPADVVGNINSGSQKGFFYTGQKSRFTAIAREPENIRETVN